MDWKGEKIRVGCFKIWVFAAEAGTAWEKWYSRVSCVGDRPGQTVRVYAGYTSFETKEESVADAEKGFEKIMEDLRRAQLPTKESE